MTTTTANAMTNTKANSGGIRRRYAIAVGALAAPVIAAGLILGSATAANAQPNAGGQCTSMTMSSAQGGANPSELTRAGQLSAGGSAGPSTDSMPVNCAPASHS